MKSKAIVLVAVCLGTLLFFSGCTGDCETDADCDSGQVCTGGKCVDKGVEFDPYYSGTEGLTSDLKSPPSELIVDQDFLIELEVTNKGSYDTEKTKAWAFMSGVSWNSFEGDTGMPSGYNSDLTTLEDNNEYDLPGVTKETGGSVTGVDSYFFGTDEKMLKVPGSYAGQEINPAITLCYPYQTKAKARACIGVEQPGITCATRGDLLVDSWAAPVVVTKVEEITSGKTNTRHTFYITVANQGGGMTFNDDASKKGIEPLNCMDDSKFTATVKNKVWVEDVTLDGVQICKNLYTNPQLLSTDKESVIACVSNEEYTGPARNANLDITLRYGYKQSKVTKIIIPAA